MDAERRKELLRQIEAQSGTHIPVAYWELRALLADSEAKDRVEALREQWKPTRDTPPCDCIDENGHIRCYCGKPEDAQDMATWLEQAETYRQLGHALGAYDQALGRD